MVGGYSIEQVTGSPVDAEKYPSVNQGKNMGGNIPGFVAELTDDRGNHLITTATYSTLDELDGRLTALLASLDVE